MISREDAAATMLQHARDSVTLMNRQKLAGLYQLRDYFASQASRGAGTHPSWEASLRQVEAQIRALGG